MIWAQHNGKPGRNTTSASIMSSKTPVWEDVHACVSLKVKVINIIISFSFIKEEEQEMRDYLSLHGHSIT